MEEERRKFLKNSAKVGTLIAVSSVSPVLANETKKNNYVSNGVVVGKSKKKEVLYKKTSSWDAFYKASF